MEEGRKEGEEELAKEAGGELVWLLGRERKDRKSSIERREREKRATRDKGNKEA